MFAIKHKSGKYLQINEGNQYSAEDDTAATFPTRISAEEFLLLRTVVTEDDYSMEFKLTNTRIVELGEKEEPEESENMQKLKQIVADRATGEEL